MRYAALTVFLLPGMALAQTAQTDCHAYTPQSISCTTTTTPARVPPPSFADAFQRGMQDAAQERLLLQQAELAAAQQRNLELQNQLLQQQLDQKKRAVASEAAVVRQALGTFVEEQAKLPEDQRIHDNAEIGLRIAAIARSMLGYEPSAEAFALAASQLEQRLPKQ